MAFASRKINLLTQSLILSVNNSSVGASGIDVPVVFTTVDNTAELASYTANYSTSTGVYTVPSGGHKNIKIKSRNLAAANATSNALTIVINGAIVKKVFAQGTYAFLEIEHDLKGLAAGATVQIKATCIAGGNTSIGGTADGFQIFATS